MRKALLGLIVLVAHGLLGFLTLTSPSAYRFLRESPPADVAAATGVAEGDIQDAVAFCERDGLVLVP